MTHVRVEFPRKLAPGRLTHRPWSSRADLVAGLPGIPGVPRCTYTATRVENRNLSVSVFCLSVRLLFCLSVCLFSTACCTRGTIRRHTDASHE
jgi:hypothetical protein